jgi:hypothetical protein
MVGKNSTNNFHPCPEPYLHHLTQRQKCELQMRSHNKFLKCNFTFCVSTIKIALFQQFLCQICSVGTVVPVRAVRYIIERLPVLIQAKRFCPSGESARTLFNLRNRTPHLPTNKTVLTHTASGFLPHTIS